MVEAKYLFINGDFIGRFEFLEVEEMYSIVKSFGFDGDVVVKEEESVYKNLIEIGD